VKGRLGLWEAVDKLKAKYGHVSSIRLGSKLFVFLHTHEAVKEAFIDQPDVFAGRPMDILVRKNKKDQANQGVVWSEGELWKMLRRFSISSLRDFGMGKMSIQGKIHEEVVFLCDEFASWAQRPFDPYTTLTNAVSNVTCNIVFGSRFDYRDAQFAKIIDLLNNALLNSSPVFGMVNLMPWLRYLPMFAKTIETKEQNLQKVFSFIRGMMDDHRQSRAPEEPARDFLDAIMDESSKEGETRSVIFDLQTVPVVNQLFIAGTDTTATTLQWVIWFLLTYPDVQEKLYRHIADAVGSETPPLYEQRAKMPYLEAFILEVQRLSSIAGMSLPHVNITEAKINGYTLPPRTIVFACIQQMHMDPMYWDEPEKFNPERFLTADNQVNHRLVGFMPFSTGKRVCLGESLAKMELFNFTAGLVQRFKMVNPAGVTKPKDGFTYGLTRHPLPYEVCAVPR
jgi:cytochrome P450